VSNSPSVSRSVISADDPQVSNLSTPINSSALTRWYINNLPAYRSGLAPQRRGLEIGMAHGYLLFGPFALLGPLRDSDLPFLAGLLGAIGLVVILSICLVIYGRSGSGAPLASVAVSQPPTDLNSAEAWSQFTSGFLIGGAGGALVAYGLTAGLAAFGFLPDLITP